MTLTRSQKDAIWRRVDNFYSKAREEKRKEFEKSFKLGPEAKALLEKYKKIQKLEKEVQDIIKSIVGDSYYMNTTIDGAKFQIYGKMDPETFVDNFKATSASQYVNSLGYPTEQQIMDELELQLLSKSFDIDAFLEKFGVK